ncbi:MAG: DUF5694 domain-containing protein [Bacteroidota bacterium]
MMNSKLPTVIVLSILISIPSLLIAQSDSGGDPEYDNIQVMVLGSFHFHQVVDQYDVKSESHQKELKAVITSIADFKPDKIALEAPHKDAAQYDSLYRSYVQGKHVLTRNERQQLGFRIANRLNHEEIFSIDVKQPWPYAEIMRWAEEHNPQFLEFYSAWKKEMSNISDSLYQEASLMEILRWLNSKEYQDKLAAVRLRRSELGKGENYVGVKPMASSYERNLKIFSNLARAAQWGDRILVIYGSGHNYFLEELVSLHPDMSLVDVSEYLTAN